MGLTPEAFELLLLLAAVVAMLARRARVPYTVGLVVAGLAMALFGFGTDLSLSKDLVFRILLPPLIFEAAIQLPWKYVKRFLPLTSAMATVGVVLAAAITAFGMVRFAGWEPRSALLFGLLISATDPVAVIAMLKELKIAGRLRVLIETESLLNDGTVAAMFAVLVATGDFSKLSAGAFAWNFAVVVAGGLTAGVAVGWLGLRFVGRTNDHLVELSFSTVVAFGSFWVAEHFGFSGVLSTVAAGLIFGQADGVLSDRGREEMISFWEYLAFVANSLIFLLIGFQVATQAFNEVWVAALIAIALVIVGRAAAVYGCSLLFQWSPLKLAPSRQHAMVWSGLRGALALALALGLPGDTPQRPMVLACAFAVVVFSVIVQGLTMKPLLGRLGELSVNEVSG
jgi:CPA1 family monovalent cation:H+ antiporter